MSKRILSAVLAVIMLCGILVLASCGDKEGDSDFKVGVILIGDAGEGYTKAHMDGIKAAAAELGLRDNQIVWMYNVEENNECEEKIEDLVSQGCSLIVSNSYGHQDFMVKVAPKHTDVTFIAMTGDTAAGSGIANFKNAFTCVYESRYIAGVVAGMKIKELVENGTLTKEKMPSSFDENDKVKIGYVGAFDYAEIVSGYTAFFLGVRSVYADVTMEVVYTGSWFDIGREGAAANYFINRGCVIIGQHADSTGAPATVQRAFKEGKTAYSVGYNIDMIPTADDAALTSPTNEWKVYYKYAFDAAMKGDEIDTNWAKGYADGAVDITALNPKAVAPGTKEAVDTAVAAIKAGTLHVFDCSKFTVGGNNLTTYISGAYGMPENTECIVNDGDTHYFAESKVRSAPYFDIRIDGIVENKDYKAE